MLHLPTRRHLSRETRPATDCRNRIHRAQRARGLLESRWKDPFYSSAFTERQGIYATRFHLDSVYTPQMVVDGSSQFSGVDAKAAQKAVTESAALPKIPVRISDVSADGATLHARVETGTL